MKNEKYNIFCGCVKIYVIIAAMAREKALEKRLDELKFYRGIIVGLVLGILSWIFTSYKTADNVLLCCAIGVVIVAFVVWVAVSFAINDKINEIEKE